MANFNDLPDEASPALTDKVFTGRGTLAGAERKPTIQAIRDLVASTTSSNGIIPRAGADGKIDIAFIPTTDIAIIPRAGTQAEMDATTLEQSELGVTTDTLRLYMGDGATPGNIHMTPLGYSRVGVIDTAGFDLGLYSSEALVLGVSLIGILQIQQMTNVTGESGVGLTATDAELFSPVEAGIASPLFRITGTDVASTGAQTIETSISNVIFAAGASTLVVTSAQLTGIDYEVFPSVEGSDATMYAVVVTKASGSFTLTAKPATPTGNVRVGLLVVKKS